MRVVLEEGAIMPKRAHADDAGLDLYCMDTKVIRAKSAEVFDTGVHMELPDGTTGMIKSRSGLYVNHGLHAEGVVDVGFTGTVKVRLSNLSDEDYEVHAGDRIAQIVIIPLVSVNTLVQVERLDDADRGDSGYGSSGR